MRQNEACQAATQLLRQLFDSMQHITQPSSIDLRVLFTNCAPGLTSIQGCDLTPPNLPAHLAHLSRVQFQQLFNSL